MLQALEKYGDFPEVAVFKLEKLAVSLTKLPGPTHPLALHSTSHVCHTAGSSVGVWMMRKVYSHCSGLKCCKINFVLEFYAEKAIARAHSNIYLQYFHCT